jgi:hypothetical protein
MCGKIFGAPLSTPPAASACRWASSTSARDAQWKAKCGRGEAGSDGLSQKSSRSGAVPKPAGGPATRGE